MAGRTLTILRIGSAAARALPLGLLTALVEALGPRLGPRLMATKADQLRRHIERVRASVDPATGERPSAIAGRPWATGDSLPVATGGGPADETPADAESAMRQGFGSYGRYWVESFRIPYLSDATIDRGFSFIGYDKIAKTLAGGTGPILVLPHLGGWEWAAAWLGRIAKVEVTAVVERLEPEEVFNWFTRLRQAYGVNVVPLGPRAMVDLMAAVKRCDIVCLLSDRDIGGNGIEVEFFGEKTTLPAGPALLSRRTGAPLLPTTVYFRGRQRICLVGDPIWPQDFADRAAEARTTDARAADPHHGDVRAGGGRIGGKERNRLIMQEVADRLEEMIRQAPDQWHLLEPNWPSDRPDGTVPTARIEPR